MQAKQARLQQEAKALSERLHAVLKDRCIRRVGFDAETPIDKTLNYLQDVIMVRLVSIRRKLLSLSRPSIL